MTAAGIDTTSLVHGMAQVRLPMLIDGRAVEASDGARFATVDPYSGMPWAELPEATVADVDAAVAAARRSWDDGEWRGATAGRRATAIHRLADLIQKNADTLGRMETMDTGKSVRETVRQVEFAARVYHYYAGYADKIDGRVLTVEQPGYLDYLVHEPVGVCALLTAWNSPMQLLANKLPAALVTGNSVVVRPSELSPGSTAYLVDLVREAGIPDGVINILTGTDLHVAQALSRHPGIDLVSLTGGVATGRSVAGAAGEDLKRVVMELGGKSAQVVFDDVDLDRVVDGIVAGIFAASGQTCIAGSRLVVHESVHDELLSRLVARAESIRLGDPLDPATEMGPIANRAHFDRISRYVDSGIAEGARMVTGGPPEDSADSLFFRPTILVGVTEQMAVWREEIFGPVLVTHPFATEEEAVALANGTAFALAGGIWTRDLGRAIRMSRAMRAGSIWVNTYRQVSPQAPFGGFGQSGMGRERGYEGILEFVQTKNVMVDATW
ncbi:aldehyde dehydrogenase family protein [Micromonospora sp. NPDC005161]